MDAVLTTRFPLESYVRPCVSLLFTLIIEPEEASHAGLTMLVMESPVASLTA